MTQACSCCEGKHCQIASNRLDPSTFAANLATLQDASCTDQHKLSEAFQMLAGTAWQAWQASAGKLMQT